MSDHYQKIWERINLLLIEDDPRDSDYIKELLSTEVNVKFSLETCDRLNKGIDLLEKHHYDIVLLDLLLPDSNGLDTFRKVYEPFPNTPFVILTGVDDDKLALLAVQNGAQDYLYKGDIGRNLLVRTILYSIERKKLLLELGKSKDAVFHNIIRNIVDGVIVVDKSGTVRFANPAAKEIFFTYEADLLGQLFGFPVIAGETTEVDIVKKDGAIHIAEMRAGEIIWNNEQAYLVSLRDITERKNTEQLLYQNEKMASIGRLTAGIAHEVNNPLTNASLVLHSLKARLNALIGETGIIEKLDLLKKHIDRASGITKELLHFSRQGTLKFVPININEVIDSTFTLMQHAIKSVSVHKSFSDIPEIMGDYLKMEQVFINILDNALEAMSGDGEIFIATSNGSGSVCVDITDTGKGISNEDKRNVFDPFYTTKEVGKGTGLGLSICYSIIEKHGGTIDISAMPRKGAKISIKLPAIDYYEKDTGSR